MAPEETWVIRRLGTEDVDEILDCIQRVYGATYANEDFYDATRLADLMVRGQLYSVGAVTPDGRLLGHMAMSRRDGATSAELGNSVIDPDARGQGLIWKIGSALVEWSLEFGDDGFLDYPTTAHHIMQRQSVKSGAETGLMLGYIPGHTDGKLASREGQQREATTIVYHPYPDRAPRPRTQVLPSYCAALVREMAEGTGLPRQWQSAASAVSQSDSVSSHQRFARRDLVRVTVARVGREIRREIAAFEDTPAACRQIDFAMSDPGIEVGVSAALDAGYWFAGWLPGFGQADAFRLQKVDRSQTNLSPLLVNPVAQSLLRLIPAP